MSEFNWHCPYCNSKQTVSRGKYSSYNGRFWLGETSDGPNGFTISAIGCSNPTCKKTTVNILYGSISTYSDGKFYQFTAVELEKRLIPEMAGKPQPDFIPIAIRQDYYEACQIRDLSPKASATLARRCLQGVIRDFCGISKNRLIDEISALREAVDGGQAPQGVTADTVDAIDHVREIGNIGAHMEKDINVIVDVEPHEAMYLIELIESLFDEWYVARERRSQRFKVLGEIAEAKKAAKKLPLLAVGVSPVSKEMPPKDADKSGVA
jgi:hypothetical protein